MEVEDSTRRGTLRKIWMDSVGEDLQEKGLTRSEAQERRY